jgi:hypothetical protein
LSVCGEGGSEQVEGDVAVPAGERVALEVVQADAVLEEHEPVMQWLHCIQYVYNALMAGNQDKAAEGVRRLPPTGGRRVDPGPRQSAAHARPRRHRPRREPPLGNGASRGRLLAVATSHGVLGMAGGGDDILVDRQNRLGVGDGPLLGRSRKPVTQLVTTTRVSVSGLTYGGLEGTCSGLVMEGKRLRARAKINLAEG